MLRRITQYKIVTKTWRERVRDKRREMGCWLRAELSSFSFPAEFYCTMTWEKSALLLVIDGRVSEADAADDATVLLLSSFKYTTSLKTISNMSLFVDVSRCWCRASSPHSPASCLQRSTTTPWRLWGQSPATSLPPCQHPHQGGGGWNSFLTVQNQVLFINYSINLFIN